MTIGLESGRVARRLAGWAPSRDHINTLIAASGATTTARARFLHRNNAYANGAVECFAANVVGPGIEPSWLPAQNAAERKRAVAELWQSWTDDADAEGLTDFQGLQRRIARELFVAGECFIRVRPRRPEDGLSVPLQLQMLPSEMLDLHYTVDAATGNRIRQGVEFDAIGRRVAYHFWRAHPGDSTDGTLAGERVRVGADQVLHVFDPQEAGQVRGLSRLTPAILPLWTLDSYDDAEMERKKTAALFSVFIHRPDADGTLFDKAAEDAAASGAGIAKVELQPGLAQVLFPGEDIKVAAPADVGNSYDVFQYRSLTRICAGLGLPYMGVTGDLTRANYANQRAALIEARRRLEAIQHGVVIYQFCRPIWQRWMRAAVVSGALDLPGYAENPPAFHRVRWIPPRWEWVDPLKDRQAEVVAVNAGFKARSQVIEAEGFDPAEVDQRIADDKARADALGLSFGASPLPPSKDRGLQEPAPETKDEP